MSYHGTLSVMIYFIVFITSAATMAFELAGARMLAPYLGTSVEVWAGVIATVLGGLSLGYWFGGRFADKHPRRDYFAGVIFLSGLAVAFAWGLRDIIPPLFTLLPLGSLTFTTFFAGIVLFVPASIFLGAISPYAAKLSLHSLEVTARTIGMLSALGAAGSIVGTITTSSWIMPRIGTSALLLSISAVLIAVSFIAMYERLVVRRLGLGAFFLFVCYGIGGIAIEAQGLVADIDTQYGRVWIQETGDESQVRIRTLHTDPNGIQCATFVNPDGTLRDELVFDYTKAFDLALAARPDARRMLMIGGCNYSYPRHALSAIPEAHMDVVEIDPGMTRIARDFFGLVEHDRMSIIHEDARTYINRSSDTYDIIFTDAFNSNASIPHHLATREAFEHTARLLTDDGVLIANLIGTLDGPAAGFVKAEIATMQTIFPTVRVFDLSSAPKQSPRNIIVMASKTPSGLESSLIEMFAANPTDGVTLTEVPLESLQGGLVLTDDYAPVESLTHPLREMRLGALRVSE